MLAKEVNDILAGSVAIPRLGSLSQNVKRIWFSAKVPTAKRDDPLNPSHALEHIKLCLCAANVNFEIFGDISKGPVDMRVLGGVNLIDIHGQAFAVAVPRLKIRDSKRLLRRATFNNISAAASDTCSTSVSMRCLGRT